MEDLVGYLKYAMASGVVVANNIMTVILSNHAHIYMRNISSH